MLLAANRRRYEPILHNRIDLSSRVARARNVAYTSVCTRVSRDRRGITIGLLGLILASTMPVCAAPPSVATIDANARASGSRKDVAVRVGHTLFVTEWPAQVQRISADAVDRFVVVGLRVSGVKFHRALSRSAFAGEIAALVAETFRADPSVREVDVWASVPLTVGKGVVVSGDLAKPTSRTVFTVSVLRGESDAALRARLASGNGVYWDEEWARALLERGD